MYPDLSQLSDILLKESYISETDHKAGLAIAHTSAEYVDFLIREELLSKALLGQALAEFYKVPYADLSNLSEGPQESPIPHEIGQAMRVVFVKASDTVAAVASDQPAQVDLQKLTQYFPGKKLRLAYALPEFVETALNQYDQPLSTRFSSIIESGNRVAPEIVDEIIRDALSYKASDIHFEPESDQVVIRFRVDGSLREAGRMPMQYYENVLNRIKVSSGMRIDEHFAPQDGAIQHTGDLHADLRVSLVPTVQGEKIVMRVLGSYVQSYTLSDVGLSEQGRQIIERYATKPFGMILTVGPTGSGKTTTLYSLLKLLNKRDVNITTIEDPVEYKITGVNQIQVREQSGVTFASGLRSIVRQDPDIILVGEIRDQETAEISVNAALTGHLLLSTFHANDAATAIPRLIELGLEPFLLASTLELIIAQRLVRKICTQCRHTIPMKQALADAKTNAAQLATYFTDTDHAYIGKGCTVCNGTGYNGRSALFEFIEVTPEMEDLILRNPSTREIQKLSEQQGNSGLFIDGVSKVKAGLTSIQEVLRVVEMPNRDVTHGK